MHLRNDLFKKKHGYLWSELDLEKKLKPIKEYYKDSKDELTIQLVDILEKNEVIF